MPLIDAAPAIAGITMLALAAWAWAVIEGRKYMDISANYAARMRASAESDMERKRYQDWRAAGGRHTCSPGMPCRGECSTRR